MYPQPREPRTSSQEKGLYERELISPRWPILSAALGGYHVIVDQSGRSECSCLRLGDFILLEDLKSKDLTARAEMTSYLLDFYRS